MSDGATIDPIAAWESVKTAGLLLSPSRLSDVFPTRLEPLHWKTVERLRRAIAGLNGGAPPPALLDVVIEEVIGLGRPLEPETGHWLKGGALGSEWTRRALSGEAIKPQRVWQGANGAELPVFVDRERRLGIGRGRRMPARVVEWLRAGERPLALLTNGWQWRLIHASLDADAFAEWDVGLWFEEGEPGPQVTALRVLLDRERLTPPAENVPAPLLAAIAASRKGQGELSAALGERVRQAVELLIQRVFRDPELPNGLAADEGTRRQLYRAATRVVMRMVVILFAEARDDLLPRSNPVYHLSYGLQGLREALQQAGAGTRDGLARLAHRHAAWPRVLALFRLIYRGSPHKDLTLTRYGGGLFEPGDAASADPLRRALAALENPAGGPHDADVYRMLDFLCVTEMRLKQGAAHKRVNVPVDFSDLSSEYIGILYEGLLDYELRRAGADDPIVFLALGDQPALPLSRLESMNDAAIEVLVEKFKVKAKRSVGSDDESQSDDDEGDEDKEQRSEAEEEDAADEGAETADTEVRAPASTPSDLDPDSGSADAVREARRRGREWAQRAVQAGRLVRRPRSKKSDALARYAADVDAAADSLILRIVPPGEWFLVRWGGTRKGAGTFYTRPGLAVPTVQRTLRSLAYAAPTGDDGYPDETAPAEQWTPHKPEEILALKVCDPAMGSASFLVASLRFLTDALYQSLHHHGRIGAQGEHTLVTLAEGRPSTGSLDEETLPCRPDDADFEPRLRAILKRYVVERCLYGVDLDPLAVELGRLALWVETLDRDLPFEFLDHKLKVGNALVGCWFDRFRDYPVLAWEREGGDKTHGNGVHFPEGGWTKAIKALRDGAVKRELVDLISRQLTFDEHVAGRAPEALHDEAAAALEAMHAMGVADGDRRAAVYREHLGSGSPIQDLRAAFDAWCALWFWPADRLDLAPTPRRFHALSDEQRAVVAELWRELRFFHWELEFPDVFCCARERDSGESSPRAGFDALVGNPPWEIQKPNSKEFFSNLDPLYRMYGKQEALRKQSALFECSAGDEKTWLDYNTRFKALSNWNKNASSPFGDGADDGTKFSFVRGNRNAGLHAQWASMRGGHHGYADPRHAFRHQGSADINTYKMFLEQAHALLRQDGHLGLVVPSGLYTDKGSTDLRRLFLERCRWQWLFGFENRLKIFDIDSRFKFCPVIVRKGGATEAIRAAFMRHDLADWAEAERHVIPYAREQVARFSPKTGSILEVRGRADLEILENVCRGSILLGGDEPCVRYSREFHMGDDAALFHPTPTVLRSGGRWLGKAVWMDQHSERWLGLLEGRMVEQHQPFAKEWVSGKGRGAEWHRLEPSAVGFVPQYLLRESAVATSAKIRRGPKLGVMNVTSSTNERTVKAAYIAPLPCGDSLYTLQLEGPNDGLRLLGMVAILDSFAFDYLVRVRLGGVHLSDFVLGDVPVPWLQMEEPSVLTSAGRLAMALNLTDPVFAPDALSIRASLGPRAVVWRGDWALTHHERLRISCILDSLVAELYGLDEEEFSWILRGCDYPVDLVTNKEFARTLDPKGFWRVHKDQAPELRQTVLAQTAFHDLKTVTAKCSGDRTRAIAAFCGTLDPALVPDLPFLDPTSGWQLPETLRLADYGLGHDDRAKEPQPVRTRLGERFLPWQLEQTPEDSWKECEIHARNILGEAGFANLRAELAAGAHADSRAAEPIAAESPPPTYGRGAQHRLFPGQQTLFGAEMEGPAAAKRRKHR